MKIKLLILIASVVLVACSSPEPRRPISRTTHEQMKESVDISKKIYEQEEAFFRQLIKNDSTKTYHKSNRGFWYTYNKIDSTNTHQLAKGDEIEYTYTVNDVQGNEIYSKDEVGVKNYFIDEQVIMQGLQEGVKLMRENEVITFLFPSYKAFGFAGNNDRIGVNQPLIYTVELLKIKSKKEKQ